MANPYPRSIRPLLAQTFTDFRTIISDNASTDGTEAICLKHAVREEMPGSTMPAAAGERRGLGEFPVSFLDEAAAEISCGLRRMMFGIGIYPKYCRPSWREHRCELLLVLGGADRDA